MMSLSRRGYLSATGSLAAGAVLPGLSACHQAAASSLRPDIAGGWVGAQVERAHAWRDGRLPASSEGDPIRVHTLIIGAGVAGLSAARSLTSAGLEDIAVLDLEDQPGGNARGHQVQGLPCPLGAHYLPMPGDQAHEVAQWLEEIGLIRQVNGRWVGDERHLCHSPQERLFVPSSAPVAPASQASAASSEKTTWWPGQWQEGLLPLASAQDMAQDMAQYRRFASDVDEVRKKLGFAIPTSRAAWNTGLDALDKLTFDQWLNQRGYTSPALRWLLDYACRDDYGAGTGRVSAWAGLHYFASRHGFELPGAADEPHDAVLTWPEGNGWLTRRLALGLGARWQAGQVVLSVDVGKHDVRVQSWSVKQQRTQTWAAGRVVLAVPLFVAHRLLRQPVPALQAVAPHMAYAPWLVSNVLLSKPFFDRPGAPLSWDNVPYTSEGVPGLAMPSLGYVDARHQSLAPATGPMLLTHYWALGGQSAEQEMAQRQALLKGDWRDWASKVAQDMARIHPDLPGLVTRIDLMRYGHAMAIPVPGLRGHAAFAALQKPSGRLYFAHSDLSAYSVFEEAFTHGARAAHQVLSAAGMPRRMA
jgi:predicted NAD/FAD-dependent oxidoreductase